MLLASIHGPSGDRPRSIRDWKACASLVSLTEGRACSPTSCRMSTDALTLFIQFLESNRRQFFGGAAHRFKGRTGSRFGRRHDGPLDDRCVANDDTVPARFGQHLNRHLAVGFCAAEVNQDGNAPLRPGPIDCRHDRLDTGAEPAARISAAPAERHFAADHLLDHQRRTTRHVGRGGHKANSDVFAHANPSMTSATASTISSEDRAPGSMWPMLRSPRNDARPRIARIGMVFSAASLAVAFKRNGSPVPPSRRTPSTGKSTSSMVFCPTSDLPRALTASIAAAKASATCSCVTSSANDLPSDMNSVPESGPDAPPTFMTRVVPTPFNDSPRFLAESSSTVASTASNPRRMLAP